MKDLLVLLPMGALGYVIYAYLIPSGAGLQFKVFFSCLPFVMAAAMVFVRPIQERKNINLFQQMRWRIQYNQRQKKYFYQQKRSL